MDVQILCLERLSNRRFLPDQLAPANFSDHAWCDYFLLASLLVSLRPKYLPRGYLLALFLYQIYDDVSSFKNVPPMNDQINQNYTSSEGTDMEQPQPKDARDYRPQGPAFEVDSRIILRIDVDLAVALGKLILATDSKNPAILALGHQLRSFEQA